MVPINLTETQHSPIRTQFDSHEQEKILNPNFTTEVQTAQDIRENSTPWINNYATSAYAKGDEETS